MIGAEANPAELLTLRVRPRCLKTIDEERRGEDHQQHGRQIHLTETEICPKNRSHPCGLNMPALRPYKVFISHAWKYNADYYRIEEFLDGAPNFDWRNQSVPSHDGIRADDTGELKKLLRDQMRPASVFLIICGMYVAHSEWIDFEIEFARRIGRPIIGILPRGNERVPLIVQNAANEMVGWSSKTIVETIRRHALPGGV